MQLRCEFARASSAARFDSLHRNEHDCRRIARLKEHITVVVRAIPRVMSSSPPNIAIVGAGPAGLMAAEVLAGQGARHGL
jgi:NADPH-dependent 2,4-dienoyl-CoA reductase/sulfur reductase-like enzyme